MAPYCSVPRPPIDMLVVRQRETLRGSLSMPAARRPRRFQVALATLATLAALSLTVGCRSFDEEKHLGKADYRPYVEAVERPCIPPAQPPTPEQGFLGPPPTVRNFEQLEPWPLSLQEVTRIALMNSQVIRDIGGRVVTSPTLAPTIYDPAIQETDPRFGVEAALSAFDTQLSSTLYFGRTEQKFNNIFFALSGGANNTGDFQVQMSKIAATGTTFAVRNTTNYVRNGVLSNLFPSAFTTLYQAEIRHPLMQGSGVEFNRIAGPSRIPGVYNGVLVARINNDITIARFEGTVRDLCRDIEQTYWELYFAYRNLDTQLIARRAAAEIWRREQARLDAEVARRDEEALARQRYYAFQAQVENALTGAGPQLGVFGAERQLRRLMGVPPADGRMIRPATEPTMADIVYDWQTSVQEAVDRRVELRQQRWLVQRRQLELTAARNYTQPRLDMFSQYGWRGFGDNLFGSSSAFDDLYARDLQDWRLGLEFSNMVGNRAGYAALRNAELQLARERAIERQQALQVQHEVAAAYAELDRARANVLSLFNNRIAALDRVKTISQRAGQTERVFFLLDAQQQAAVAQSSYDRAVADYNIAILNFEYRRGTMLTYAHVDLSEGPWSQEAHASAAKQARQMVPRNRWRNHPDSNRVSAGQVPFDRPLEALPDGLAPGDVPLPPEPAPFEAEEIR